MTATFINAFCKPIVHAKKKPVQICIAIVQPVGVPVQVMWQLRRDTSHVPSGLEYPTGV